MQMQHATPDAAGFAAYMLRAGGPLVCLRSQLPLISEDAPVRWVHVAYEGEWRGHHSGPFRFTRERFEEAVRNFERQRNAVKLDFDHETDYAAPGASVPARGWVHKLEVREDESGVAHLWALTEFGAEAVRKNREGGYRFCSGVFDFNAIDRVSGEPVGLAMLRLALTDDPFIDGQQPIRLSRAAPLALNGDSMKIDKAEFVRRLRKLEGEEVTPDQIAQLAQAMALMAEVTVGGKGEGGDDAPPEPAPMSAKPDAQPDPKALNADAPPAEPVVTADAPPAADPAQANDLAAQIMEATGMDLGALIEALKSMAGGQMPAAPAPLSAATDEQTKLLLASTKQALSVAVKERDEAIKQLSAYREKEADEAVETLVKTGRLLDTGRKFARELYLSNREGFDAFAASLPEVVPVGSHASASEPPTQDTPALDESDPEVKRLRRLFSGTGLTKAQEDAAIRKTLANRNPDQTRV